MASIPWSAISTLPVFVQSINIDAHFRSVPAAPIGELILIEHLNFILQVFQDQCTEKASFRAGREQILTRIPALPDLLDV